MTRWRYIERVAAIVPSGWHIAKDVICLLKYNDLVSALAYLYILSSVQDNCQRSLGPIHQSSQPVSV